MVELESNGIILTRDEVRRIDECAVHELHFPSIVLMENAGRGAADWIAGNLGTSARSAKVFCGTGNNGGDGFVIARHLRNAGWCVEVFLLGDPQRMTADTETNQIIARAMGIGTKILRDAEAIQAAIHQLSAEDVVIDALLGTGFSGSVREPLASAIRWLNGAPRSQLVAIDVPSGFDCDSGEVAGVAIHADTTLTFVARKTGFQAEGARAFTGEVFVFGIGTPPELIERVRAETE